jgi:hypothetical protein
LTTASEISIILLDSITATGMGIAFYSSRHATYRLDR